MLCIDKFSFYIRIMEQFPLFVIVSVTTLTIFVLINTRKCIKCTQTLEYKWHCYRCYYKRAPEKITIHSFQECNN